MIQNKLHYLKQHFVELTYVYNPHIKTKDKVVRIN